jgi:5-methylthioribose kinase
MIIDFNNLFGFVFIYVFYYVIFFLIGSLIYDFYTYLTVRYSESKKNKEEEDKNYLSSLVNEILEPYKDTLDYIKDKLNNLLSNDVDSIEDLSKVYDDN